jgi:multicomponent Na+:H+ antiporter subunit F
MASVLVTLALLLLSVGYARSIYADVALVTALLTFAGGMVFVQYLERWG